MIPREHKFDFHRRDWDIHIWIFSRFRTIQLVQFNHDFGMIITHEDIFQWLVSLSFYRQLTAERGCLPDFCTRRPAEAERTKPNKKHADVKGLWSQLPDYPANFSRDYSSVFSFLSRHRRAPESIGESTWSFCDIIVGSWNKSSTFQTC
jgi:hypothetical protein